MGLFSGVFTHTEYKWWGRVERQILTTTRIRKVLRVRYFILGIRIQIYKED